MASAPKFADDLLRRLSPCEVAIVELAILYGPVIDRTCFDRPGNEYHDVGEHDGLRGAMQNRATREDAGVRDT